MSKEYIERSATIAALKDLPFQWDIEDLAVYEAIEEVPTADVAPIIHGEWETVYSDQLYQCSNCKKTNEPTDFCPHCGADMRGVCQQ